MANPDFPQTREEMLLNAAAGFPYDAPVPVPQSRAEKLIAFLVENGIPGNVKIGADVATVADLPAEGKVGEMHYVTAESLFYVWKETDGAGEWIPVGADFDPSEFARAEGTYPDMKVGYSDVAEYAAYAEQLDSNQKLTVSTPFVFRPAGGGADVEGYLGSKAKIAAIYGNTLVWNQLVGDDTAEVVLKSGHVYLTRIDGTDARVSGTGASVPVTGGTDNVFDLTRMFGARNVPASVEAFRAFFPLPYYAYDAGRFLNFAGTGIKTVGFNALTSDGTARLLGGHEYEIVGTYTALSYSTGETITPVSGIFTPSADGILTVTGAGTDTCVHLVWSGYRNGETAQYRAETKGLPVNVYFPSGMRSAGSARDELRTDKAIRRLNVVDLGALNWGKTNIFYSINFPAKKNGAGICTDFPVYYFDGTTHNENYLETRTDGYLYFRFLANSEFAGMTPDQFKARMSGVMFCYETASIVETPINPPLDLTLTSSDYGTEMLLPENSAEPTTTPMYAAIDYVQNLRDKLQRLPNGVAEGDYYVHSDGVNQKYKPLPVVPTADGVYTLKCTVTSGTPTTFAWVADAETQTEPGAGGETV